LLGAADGAAPAAGAGVDPVVQGELQAVEQLLDVGGVEAGVEGRPAGGLAFALGVAQIDQVGRVGDEKAVAPGGKSGREAAAVSGSLLRRGSSGPGGAAAGTRATRSGNRKNESRRGVDMEGSPSEEDVRLSGLTAVRSSGVRLESLTYVVARRGARCNKTNG